MCDQEPLRDDRKGGPRRIEAPSRVSGAGRRRNETDRRDVFTEADDGFSAQMPFALPWTASSGNFLIHRLA